jgi:hypothetical protein
VEALALGAASILGVAALRKLDKVYDCIVGTTERPGLLGRVRRIERKLQIVPDKDVSIDEALRGD